ncbi:MAG: M18 family aminopeptidase [Lachnospirales bacterium]
MENLKNINEELLSFLYESPTPHYAVKTIKEELVKENFTELFEKDKWELKAHSKYFLTKNGTSILAFETGDTNVQDFGFTLIGAHTDAPCFKIKPNPEMIVKDHYLKLNTEGYGGALLGTWFDRPLSLAGEVFFETSNGLKSKLLNIQKPIMIIPSLAIHQNREANKGFEINKQNHTLPLLTFVNETLEKDNFLLKVIAKELDIDETSIIDFDLFLYDNQKGNLVGYEEDMISSARLDDLWMCFTGLKGLLNSTDTSKTKVLLCVDNEEVGSKTAQGGDSAFLLNILKRITLGLGQLSEEDFLRAIVNSQMISADSGHAFHPNFAEKCDPTSPTFPNKGMIIKYTAGARYATSGQIASEIITLANKYDIPVQKYIDRSDALGGSTIGPMMSSRLTIPVCDMGMSMLAMHSIRELGGAKDTVYSIDLFNKFFSVK